MESNARIARSPEALAAADKFKKQYIDKGLLGVKAGKGFYTYPSPAYARPGFLTGEPEMGTSRLPAVARFQPAYVQMLLLRERAERHPSDRSPDELRR
jgi:3-hydroxybutyryl-CoA dehydrogenase